jgi:HEPN domain-containing protein
MNRQELQDLSELRLREARSLFMAGLPDGAYYLAGYSVECALKACIAKRTKEHDFPEKPELVRKLYVHKLTELMVLSQLAPLLEVTIRANPSLKVQWSIVQRWSEESRYERMDTASAEAVLKAIEDGSEGILSWIRQHW